MKLDKIGGERDRILKFLNETCSEAQCEFCGHNQFMLGDHYVTIDTCGPGGEYYPSIVVICHKCGHQNLFNAKMKNLVPKEEVKEEVKEERTFKRLLTKILLGEDTQPERKDE